MSRTSVSRFVVARIKIFKNNEVIFKNAFDYLSIWQFKYFTNFFSTFFCIFEFVFETFLSIICSVDSNLERLEKNESWTLGFLYDFSIPFDNNQAERDLRMVKTRTKISWCFRSEEWTEWFCRIRSYISTLRKQDKDIYKALKSIFSWEVLLPEFLKKSHFNLKWLFFLGW